MKFREDLYSQELNVVNGVKLTFREMDLISCIISGRTAKGAASVLFISPKTAENHIYSAMSKTKVSSRDSLISFIEKSQKLQIIQEYYRILVVQCGFENSLRNLAKLKKDTPRYSLSLNCSDLDLKEKLVSHLGKHLQLAGIKVIYSDNGSSWENKKAENTDGEGHTLLFTEENTSVKYLDFSYYKNYYTAVLKILEEFFSKEDIKSTFRDIDYTSIGTDFKPSEGDIDPINSFEETTIKPSLPSQINEYRRLVWGLGSFLLAILGLGLVSFMGQGKTVKETNYHLPLISSDLTVPKSHSLLQRLNILKDIDKAFDESNEIQVIALVGIGGAGKTTLARQYASTQKSSIVWEFNAETKESLRSSFVRLAQALSKTEEDEKTLRALQDIKDTLVKVEKIINFVKERLRASPNWFLIFDNVENYEDIRMYFPQGFSTWGQGKIIITTRDVNIQNNKNVNFVIRLGELNFNEKLQLFMKIVRNEDLKTLSSTDFEAIKEFLEEIPSYPLDVSIAAYYIKATGMPYKNYLKRLEEYDDDFVSMQENLLRGSGDYTKTRHSIITLALHDLIKAHKDFANLLLFVSLIDSQNIPINLLEKCQNPAVVDRFIYQLKKFSLIREDSYHPTHTAPTFSIHRSTQEIALTYLTKVLAQEKKNSAINTITQALEGYIKEAVENQDYQTMKTLINHCIMFLKHHSFLTEASRGIIESQLGYLYLCDINPNKAKIFLEKGLVSLNKFNSEHPLRIAKCLVSLGMVFYSLGDFVKAKDLIEQGISIYKKNNSHHCTEFALALRNLGLTVSVLGGYRKTKDLLEQSYNIYKEIYPEDHPKVAAALNVLGFSYYNLGYYEKSKSILEQSITIYKNIFPKNPYVSGESFIVLGNIYMKQGDYKKAKDLLEQSLRDLLSRLPNDHFVVMWAIRSLGSVHQKLGNYKEAKRLLEESVLAYEKHFGKNHTETSEFLLGLGELYLAEGNFERAEALMKKSLNIFQENNHPLCYASLESLAELYLRKSQVEKNKMATQESENHRTKAADCLREALEVAKRYFPDDSSHISRIQHKLDGLLTHDIY